jgi:adenosine deaminase
VKKYTVLLCAVLLSFSALGQPARPAGANERAAALYLEHVRSNPLLLNMFLRAMPKGGDLHNHLTGAVYAEHYIQLAADGAACIDRRTMAIVGGTCDAPTGTPPRECDPAMQRPPAKCALQDGVLYRELIHALSMRDFVAGAQSGEDHFFDTFGKFGPAAADYGALLAEVLDRAAEQNEQYMEVMFNPGLGAALQIGSQIGPADLDGSEAGFERFRQKVIAAGLEGIVGGTARTALDAVESRMRELLRCPAGVPRPGCSVTVRYIVQVYRAMPREAVFAQMIADFEFAKRDTRVVSVNPVQPEDSYTSMHDFDLHMAMFAYLHKLYPQVKLTMHAGELAPGLVPPSGLRDHIRKSIEIAGAVRIGHGVDVMYEDNPLALLREMALRKVAVEICLTSNDLILGVRGAKHPFPLYLQYGVPVAIATDDEGVSRSDMTREYQRAVEGYGLTYPQLKEIARNSLVYSFAAPEDKVRMLNQLQQRFTEFESMVADRWNLGAAK